MEKMRMESINITEQNIEKIGEMFPNVITEVKDENGKLKKAINFQLLKQILSDDVIDGDEAYEFTWVGKKASMVEAGRPIRKTLRPCKEESKDWDNTENLYIEGDNLEVLKVLQESYLGAVKMIYIDPPYNTGKDFVYRDNFQQGIDEYNELTGIYDDDSNRLFVNNESNGRFHSAWCSMILPRLQLAKNLLKEDGVIFISIDNNEIANMINICNEVFNERNYIGTIANINNPKGRSDDKYLATAHEYVVVYAKSISSLKWYGFEPTDEIIKRYNKIDDSDKKYREIDLRKTGENDLKEDRPNLFYYFYFNEVNKHFYPSREEICPDGYIQIKPQREDNREGNWRWGLDTSLQQISDLIPKYMPNRKVWGVMQKDYLDNRDLVKPTSAWTFKDVNSERGSGEFIELGFDKRIFPKPKPLGTLMRCIQLGSGDEDVILDFFSGSATTAHAMFCQNIEDAKPRQFILIQLPEKCSEDSDAYIEGYSNICEIGKERIRRAGEKVKDEAGLLAKDLDTGFRVLKLDSTNMKDVYYAADEYSQGILSGLESNIKEDRDDLDLLFACLIEWGLPLSLPHTSDEVNGVLVHTINGGDLIGVLFREYQ